MLLWFAQSFQYGSFGQNRFNENEFKFKLSYSMDSILMLFCTKNCVTFEDIPHQLVCPVPLLEKSVPYIAVSSGWE